MLHYGQNSKALQSLSQERKLQLCRQQEHLAYPVRFNCKSSIQSSIQTEYKKNLVVITKLVKHTLITVQFPYAPGDHGFGLKRRRGIPVGTLPDGM
jgi:hypothetical protein